MLQLSCLVLVVLATASITGIASSDANKITPRIFHVRDYGATPNSNQDAGKALRAAIHAAIASGSCAEILLENGTYLVKPELPRQFCLPVQQATNLAIRGLGKGTKIVINDPSSGCFLLWQCRQVMLRDLVVDYDPVPFCQGTIKAVDVDRGSFDLDVEAGYPTPDADNFLKAVEPYGKWGMIIDPATRRIRSGTLDHYMTPRWEHQGGRTYRFFTPSEHYRLGLRHMRTGDSYVHLARGHGSAVLAQECNDVRIENVMVHSSPGLVVGLVGNQGEIKVRSLEARFPTNSTRLLTANADGVHCQQNRSGPVIEDCYFEGMADDGINIYAPPNVLREVRSANQWLVSSGAMVQKGDRLQVLDPRSGKLRGEVKVTEIQMERRAFLITVDPPIPGATPGADYRSADTLYNLDACGANFQIRRNHMNGNRRYGCLLRAGGGIVEDNTFEDTTGAGVVLTNEPDWPEGPVPWGITIRHNRFIRGGTCIGYTDSPHGAALAIRAVRLGHDLAENATIRNIQIENNSFQDRAGAAIFLGGTIGVTVRDNRITAELSAELKRKGPAILIERSANITLLDNSINDSRTGTTAAIEVGAGVESGGNGVKIDGLKTLLAPLSKPVLYHQTK